MGEIDHLGVGDGVRVPAALGGGWVEAASPMAMVASGGGGEGGGHRGQWGLAGSATATAAMKLWRDPTVSRWGGGSGGRGQGKDDHEHEVDDRSHVS